jgi:hypothetical protein
MILPGENGMNLSEYKNIYASAGDAAPGGDAITSGLQTIYGTQEPKHWGTVIKYVMGGDPIEGISAYQCNDNGIPHLHFCTYGYTSLYYDEDSVGGEYSGFGFEMTFRLASPLPPTEEPIWVCNLLQNLGRYVFDSGKWFDNYHWIPTNGPIRHDAQTDIVGLAFLHDPTLTPIDSPHGNVEFIQAFGITQTELDTLKARTCTGEEIIELHRTTNPLLITDLSRQN